MTTTQIDIPTQLRIITSPDVEFNIVDCPNNHRQEEDSTNIFDSEFQVSLTSGPLGQVISILPARRITPNMLRPRCVLLVP